MNTTDNIVILKDKLGIALIILAITWLFCNYLVKRLIIKYEESNDLIDTCVKTRKTIFFEIIALILTSFFRIRIITWITMLYYMVIFILMIGSQFLSLVEIFMPDTGNRFNKDLWILFGVNTLNMLTHLFTAYILVNIIYQLV